MKYLIVFRNTVEKALIYRSRIVTYAITGSFSPLLMIFIWSSFYQSGRSVGGFSYPELLSYYLATIIISIWGSAVHENVKEDIVNGELSNFIIKPYNYFLFRLAWELGWYVVKFILFIVPISLFIALTHQPITLHFTYWFIPAFILSYLLGFFLSFAVGLSAFFVTYIAGIRNTYNMLTELITGKLFPLSFFPPLTVSVLSFLPFFYLYYFPVQLLTGSLALTKIIEGLLIQLVWTLLLGIFFQSLWNKGIKKFSAVGL